MILHARTAWPALALSLAAANLAPGGPVDLSPEFVPGTEVHYVSQGVIHHDVEVDEAGLAEKIVVRTESGMTLAVTSVDEDGSASIEWRLRYLVLSSDGAIPGISQLLDYDSREARGGVSPLALLFGALIDRPVTLRVDASGNVLDYRGPAGATGIGPLGGLATGFLSRQAFQQLPLFITSGAQPGGRARSKWSTRITMDMPLGVGSLEVEQQFKRKRVSRRHQTAIIEMTGEIASPGASASPSTPQSGRSVAGVLVVEAGRLSGTYVWDLSAGQLASAETRLELETELDSALGRMRLKQVMTAAVVRSSLDALGLPAQPDPAGPPSAPSDQPVR